VAVTAKIEVKSLSKQLSETKQGAVVESAKLEKKIRELEQENKKVHKSKTQVSRIFI